MTTLIWITIALVVTANVAVVSWTQAAIWRRLDRIEQTQQADYDARDTDTLTDPEHPND